MYLNKYWAWLLTLLLWVAAGSAAAETPLNLSLILGDLDSQTAVAATVKLQNDPLLQGVKLRVYSSSKLAQADQTELQQSNLVLAQITGRSILREGGEVFKQIAARGGKLYAVGLSYDADFADYGLQLDKDLQAYMSAGGADNAANMIRLALVKFKNVQANIAPPQAQPEIGAFDVRSKQLFADFDSYQKAYAGYKAGQPWIAILFYRSSALSGQTDTVKTLAEQLEAKGYNVLPVFGYPYDKTLEKMLVDGNGKSRVEAIAALALKIGASPDKTVPTLTRLGVPVLNGIALNSQSQAQWSESATGLDVMERAWQVALPEFAGEIAPTVVASKESMHDKATGQDFVREVPIPERIARYADRLDKWAKLRHTANADKKVALLYYNYPPGKENIGASYLNVLPESLLNIMQRMRQEGYQLGDAPTDGAALKAAVKNHGINLGNWEPGAVAEAAASGRAVLLPITDYQKWFDALPETFKTAMLKAWGKPEDSKIGAWTDNKGQRFLILPALQYGNLLLAPQPSRGWEQDVKKLYHDVSMPPHHQYVAFYLWLQKGYRADAMIHLGTHATHEWLSGKEVGFTAADPGEILMADVPQIYPYIMDDVGEALQAKRRAMATIISHMTPPLDKADLNPELAKLAGLLDDYNVAAQKSEQLAKIRLDEINQIAAKAGLLKDLKMERAETGDQLEELEHYLKEIREKKVPMGLHTFGKAPDEAVRQRFAEAIVARAPKLKGEALKQNVQATSKLIGDSANAEMNALIDALAGRYIPAGSGGDPLRNPDALPTGKDLYGFDPSRIPSEAVYNEGARLAEQVVADFKKQHGHYPERLVFNLWGVESSRHEGVMEAEIMHLLGVKPHWDERGRTQGVDVIARDKLGRPRVDVTIIPSGLYRDLFASVIKLLDQAETKAQEQDEPDNPLRRHIQETQAELVKRGLKPEEALDMASARLFSVPSGAYGTNLDRAIPLSNTWTDEKQLADVFFNRMHHVYGRGHWGEAASKDATLAVDLFKLSLKGTDAVIHSRSSNVYATLDGDDFFQYLGGTAMAARQVNGKTPEVLVADLADPTAAKTMSLERYQGREMQSRYLNPKWIESMLKEGYAGARFINMVAENLWGWQVTVPEAVGAEKWQAMYETYVEDKYQLDIQKKFEQADNLLAYQAMVDRMLVAINKGYWQADPAVKAKLEQVNQEVIAKAGVACNKDTCSSPEITKLAEQQDAAKAAKAAAPGAQAQPPAAAAAQPPQASQSQQPPPAQQPAQAQAQAAPNANQPLEGYEMEEKKVANDKGEQQQALSPEQNWWLLLSVLALFAAGYWRGYLERKQAEAKAGE
ncbi:cobaltochelatase subunit CobN [Methylomonas koyamae]|uniref:cobaltochelatase subunit CobN n=2 Tax=Methylomonas koyamae TaxID=702114 RepID=UPI001C323B40|nr:cobaltochelatase subunit CobN [Methylomonas koyamae]BBL56594.1 cobalamin biosynthesis protein CobN [Methylomonas koyamae]